MQPDEDKPTVTFLGLPLRISGEELPPGEPFTPLPPEKMAAWCEEIDDAQ
jgi:hypothetical protein